MDSNEIEADGTSCIFQPLPTKADFENVTASTPNSQFEQFSILTVGLQNELATELISKPIADVDQFYAKQEVRIH